MGQSSNRSAEYFFTGNYYGDDDDNDIDAIGIGGNIYAKGGDDHITVGSIATNIHTGSGNDTVVGGAAYVRINDSSGHLRVKGAAGYIDINKNDNGNTFFAGAAGGVSISHSGEQGDVKYSGTAFYNQISRKGKDSHVTFEGAGGYNHLWHETNQGDLSFTGAGGGNKLDRTWFDKYQGSRGDVIFQGAGASNVISSRVQTGNITFEGAGFYNQITRKGTNNGLDDEGIAFANADDIILTRATMTAPTRFRDNRSYQVTAIKSLSEPNTYLFACTDHGYTFIKKVTLSNHNETNQLLFSSTNWSKKGNHIGELANQVISSNTAYHLSKNQKRFNINISKLGVEYQKIAASEDIEKTAFIASQWREYGNNAFINAEDVELLEAKMNHYLLSGKLFLSQQTKAVKSNRKPNTYLFSNATHSFISIMVVQFRNNPETKALEYQISQKYLTGGGSQLARRIDLANEDISTNNGYYRLNDNTQTLSDIRYRAITARNTTSTIVDINKYSGELIKPTIINKTDDSSGDINFKGIGGGNIIKSSVTRGNVFFEGGGIANVIEHDSKIGNTKFEGGGAANIIIKSGDEGNLTFDGAGIANVLVHQSRQGEMAVNAGGAVNVLVRIGDGQYQAALLALGNISIHKGNGNSNVSAKGGFNTHTQIGSGDGSWSAIGGFNVLTQVGQGDIWAYLAGGANILNKIGNGDVLSSMIGGGNVITHITDDEKHANTTVVALGGANILTKKGGGNALALMGGLANVLTHVGNGETIGVMVGGGNVLTKVGNGDTIGVMLGLGNVLTHVGDGLTLGIMGAAGNIFTKVGNGTSIAVMTAVGNLFTHVGEGDAWALMGGLGNVFTKVGNGDALALMIAKGNVFTHVGDGTSVALMLAKGNISTKVGNGLTISAMIGGANIFTHIGNGVTFAAMIGKANIMTKVGNGLTAALMVGNANIFTHVGEGISIGLFAGQMNIMTKVGNGTTLAAMFGKANIMTHIGNGLTGVLALGEANIITKVGDDFMGVIAAAKANVITHVGHATTAAVLAGKANILTKVGNGTTVGLLLSDLGNIMTHVGDGVTIGVAKGKANIMTKIGNGLGINLAWGQANIFTQIGDGDRYSFAKGDANVFTKVGDGREISVVHGKANIITHVGDGDNYTGAWGKANIITKVGSGRNVVLAKGDANIITHVGGGDSFNGLWSKGNIVTKVGDGMQITAAKGKANITTTVGDGLNVTTAYGDLNINTKVGSGTSVNVAWGKYNLNTKVGDGLNVSVMKGTYNANIHVGNGLMVNASYARNNVVIKVGNGDFYSLAVATSNTESHKLSTLFGKIKQTLLGVAGSKAINYLVQGNEASSSGTRNGHGVIKTPEITKLNGFKMTEVEEINSNLGDELTGHITRLETPDLNEIENELNESQSPQTGTIYKHILKNMGTHNALSDKQNAEDNRQRLEQEKDQQLGKISGTQQELESTDQEALKNNGQAHREAMQQEAEIETAELIKLTQHLDTHNDSTEYDESAPVWHEHFAGGILSTVNSKLTEAKTISGEQLTAAQHTFIDSQKKSKDAVVQSEIGVAKVDQYRADAQQDIDKAKMDADIRKEQARAKKVEAIQAQEKAHSAADEAQIRVNRDARTAEQKARQAQVDAKSAQQNDDDRPDRQGATGSGLSGEAYVVQGAGETERHINTDTPMDADSRFSQGLTEQELEGLSSGAQAINRLQINAGIRGSNTGHLITSKYSQSSTDDAVTVNPPSRDIAQKTPVISGVNLQALGRGENAYDAAKNNLIGFGFKSSQKIFDMHARGKELKNQSFHFTQMNDLLNQLPELTREIGNVLLTSGNDVLAKDFRTGICLALSGRYMMEERVHGPGGGKAYMTWLSDLVKAYKSKSNSPSSDSSLGSIKQKKLNDYHQQFIGSVIKDLLSMQYSQDIDRATLEGTNESQRLYGGKLEENGLTNNIRGHSLDTSKMGYEQFMDTLREPNSSKYISFMSENHAMAIVIRVEDNGQKTFQFYDPNLGAKSFTQYDDFRRFMDKANKGIIASLYQFPAATNEEHSFRVRFNEFHETDASAYDGQWKTARDGEQSYVLRALQEQETNFTFGRHLSGKVTNIQDGVVTLEVTIKSGRTVSVDVPADNIDHATNLIRTNIDHILTNPYAKKLSLNVDETSDSVRVRVLELNPTAWVNDTNTHLRLSDTDDDAYTHNVNEWERFAVTSQAEVTTTRFDGQIIIQTENDPVVAKAAANLAGKHPNKSVVVQVDSEGNYRVVYGDPAHLSGNLRWQIVGHGRHESDNHNLRLSGYSASELSINLAKFQQDLSQSMNIDAKPKHISLVGCSLISGDTQTGFARQFMTAMDKQGLRSDISARSTDVAVDPTGRKFTFDEHGNWVNQKKDNKVVLSWNEQGEIITYDETIRQGVAEGDIDILRVGMESDDTPARGAIGDNQEEFVVPTKRRNNQAPAETDDNRQNVSYSGNIQVDVGDGEFTAVNWGTSNMGIKVGTGGFKSLAFGDNNIMVHIGDGNSQHSVDIAGYQAFEGAQLFIGNRNVSFNMGRSNDLLVMMEKSIITPPLVNPFDGASRISGVLQSITRFGEGQNWLAAQQQQWTLAGAKKFVKEMSGLDQTSSVDYTTLVDLDSQYERSGRGLLNDTEATLNKKYNQWLGNNGNQDTGKLTRADKLRKLNEDLIFNFAVGGQGADIQVTTSNWNFMFGDNIQSILDTNLGSLFGLMTQQTSKSGLVVTTFTYNPTDLPRQLKNRLLGRVAEVNSDMTLGDIFGVDYTADGRIVSRNGESVDGEAIIKEMLEVIGEFSDEQLTVFADPAKFLDSMKAGIDMGSEGIKSFAENHGLKSKEPDPEEDSPAQNESEITASETSPTQERPFGFNALNLPNIFATIFNKNKQAEMSSMVQNIKENLTADLINMEDKTFDFLRNSGHLQGDGDMHVSLGNYNFNWGGDGKDLGTYLGDNNNFWGGRGDDVYYAMGISNIFSGGKGNDTGVLMGRENWMFGDEGDDVAIVAGRVNFVNLGAGNDETFVFGEGGQISTGIGHDYAVVSGNFNHIDTGADQDYSVTIGNNNQIELNAGHDFANVFGNQNMVRGGSGHDSIKLMGFHSTLKGEDGNDHLIADTISKLSYLDGGEGNDLMVLGGYQNTFNGGNGVDSFIVNGHIIENTVGDISSEDNIVFDGIDWNKLWFERSGYDLKLLILRDVENETDQAQFEKIGSVMFRDYFNGKRAKVIINMGDKNDASEREYNALSDEAIDSLVLIMSSIEPEIGSNDFIDKLDVTSRYVVTTAWSNVVHGNGLVI